MLENTPGNGPVCRLMLFVSLNFAQDELQIPLELSTIPTPKEFKDS